MKKTFFLTTYLQNAIWKCITSCKFVVEQTETFIQWNIMNKVYITFLFFHLKKNLGKLFWKPLNFCTPDILFTTSCVKNWLCLRIFRFIIYKNLCKADRIYINGDNSDLQFGLLISADIQIAIEMWMPKYVSDSK